MSDFFSRLQRGFEAARQGMGADELARTNAFELAQSGMFPTAILKRKRADGAIVVEVQVADAYSVMTPAEFDRFVRELGEFRAVIEAAVEAAKRTGS